MFSPLTSPPYSGHWRTAWDTRHTLTHLPARHSPRGTQRARRSLPLGSLPHCPFSQSALRWSGGSKGGLQRAVPQGVSYSVTVKIIALWVILEIVHGSSLPWHVTVSLFLPVTTTFTFFVFSFWCGCGCGDAWTVSI